MKHVINLGEIHPKYPLLELEYTDKVYSPAHSAIDTIILADMYIGSEFKICDVGSGSGVIALALKTLHPDTTIYATDNDDEAIKTIKLNRQKTDLGIKVVQTNLLDGLGMFDLIVTNLPSFDSKDLKIHPLHGPKSAYFAKNTDGLYLYRQLIKDLKNHLYPGGFFVAECQQRLQPKFLSLSQLHGLTLVCRTDFSFALVR